MFLEARIAARSAAVRLARLLEPRAGAGCGSTDASRRILREPRNGGGPVTNSVPRDDLECHLPYSPRLIVERRQDGGGSDLVPVPEQTPGRPHLEPVARPARFTGLGPPSRWASQCHDQVRVRIAAGEQVDAPVDDGALTPAGALSPDALPRRPLRWPHASITPARSGRTTRRSLRGWPARTRARPHGPPRRCRQGPARHGCPGVSPRRSP